MKGPVQQFELEIAEYVNLYDESGEFRARFCVSEVKGQAKIWFEIRLRDSDGSYMHSMAVQVWDTEIGEPNEMDVSEENEPENVLSITVTEFRGGRASLDVVSPTGWEVVPLREIPGEE